MAGLLSRCSCFSFAISSSKACLCLLNLLVCFVAAPYLDLCSSTTFRDVHLYGRSNALDAHCSRRSLCHFLQSSIASSSGRFVARSCCSMNSRWISSTFRTSIALFCSLFSFPQWHRCGLYDYEDKEVLARLHADARGRAFLCSEHFTIEPLADVIANKCHRIGTLVAETDCFHTYQSIYYMEQHDCTDRIVRSSACNNLFRTEIPPLIMPHNKDCGVSKARHRIPFDLTRAWCTRASRLNPDYCA